MAILLSYTYSKRTKQANLDSQIAGTKNHSGRKTEPTIVCAKFTTVPEEMGWHSDAEKTLKKMELSPLVWCRTKIYLQTQRQQGNGIRTYPAACW
jgi:hypothetical protein